MTWVLGERSLNQEPTHVKAEMRNRKAESGLS